MQPFKSISLVAMCMPLIQLTFGQETITSPNFSPIWGTTYIERGFGEVDPGSPGNQIWDFTGATLYGEDESVIADPSMHQYAGLFPEADYVLLIDDEDGEFYTHSNETLELIGYFDEDSVKILSNPRTILEFPSEYNNTWSDTFNNAIGLAEIPGGIVGWKDVIVDGWETVMLPNGVTFDNCIRSKATISKTIYFAANTQEWTETEYLWLSNDYPIPVVRINVTEFNGIPSVLGRFISDFTLDVEISSQLPKMEIFPNPASNYITVRKAEGLATVSIIDLSGQIVLRQNANQALQQISLPELSSGMYSICLFQNGKSQRQKLIIE